MSQSSTTEPTDRRDYSDLSNKELLEEVAKLDPDTYPIAKDAQIALDHWEESV